MLGSRSRPHGADFGTSELETNSGKRVGESNETRIYGAGEMGFLFLSGTAMQQAVSAERSKNYPSNSAKNPRKECFSDSPFIQLDPHHQITGMSSDQMVRLARTIGLEILLAAFGMLKDLLLRNGGKTVKKGGDRANCQSTLFSRAMSTVVESVAFGSFYSLPTITESVGSDPSGDVPFQQPRSSRQADAALGSSVTQVTDVTGSDSLKTLGRFPPTPEKITVVICTSGQWKFRLTHIHPVDQMKGGMCSLRRCWN